MSFLYFHYFSDISNDSKLGCAMGNSDTPFGSRGNKALQVKVLKGESLKTLWLDPLCHCFCAMLAWKIPLKIQHIHSLHTDIEERSLSSVPPNLSRVLIFHPLRWGISLWQRKLEHLCSHQTTEHIYIFSNNFSHSSKTSYYKLNRLSVSLPIVFLIYKDNLFFETEQLKFLHLIQNLFYQASHLNTIFISFWNSVNLVWGSQ